MHYKPFGKKWLISLFLSSFIFALNPFQEWQKPPHPQKLVTRNQKLVTRNQKLVTRNQKLVTRDQKLVTRDQKLMTTGPPVAQETISVEHRDIPHALSYEDITVFSLKAVIAAFHFSPKTFGQDQIHAQKYFSRYAWQQVEHLLFSATGHGLLDQCVLQQLSCDAIPREPLIIEKKMPHYYQVRLPLILSTKQHVDILLAIHYQNKLEVTDFSMEIPNDA